MSTSTASLLGNPYVLAALATLCWGVVVIPLKLATLPGRLGIAISMSTGALTMTALAGPQMLSALGLPWPELARIALIGTVQFAVGCALYYECIQSGSISIAVPITRAKVILMLPLSIALGLEHFTWPLLGACVLVVLGGVLIGIRPGEKVPTSGLDGHRRSLLLAGIACVFWAIGETLMGTLPKSVPPLAANGLMLWSGLLVYLAYAFASGLWRQFRGIAARDIGYFAIHGIVSFSVAYGLFVAAVGLMSPTRVACVTSTYPLLSAVIGWVLFKERFTILLAFGACLLVGGVILLQLVK